MGQYYKIVTKANGKFHVNDRATLDDDSYCMAKLLEFSWWENRICKALANQIVDKPTKVAWVGDYAEDEECKALGFSYDIVWGDMANNEAFEPAPEDFSLDNYAYLVNHDKKQFVDLKKYKEASTDKDGWCIFPVAILTAIGNGRGGGDYHHDDPLVGSWAYDTLEITNGKGKTDGYEEIEPVFID